MNECRTVPQLAKYPLNENHKTPGPVQQREEGWFPWVDNSYASDTGTAKFTMMPMTILFQEACNG
jgi:hypothetical protein